MSEKRLIDLAYDSGTGARPWTDFLSALRKTMRSSSASLTFDLPPALALDKDIAVSEHRVSLWKSHYYSAYQQHDTRFYRDMESGRVYNLEHIATRGDSSRNPALMKYCRAAGIDHSLMVHLGNFAGVRARINVARGDDIGVFGADDVDVMNEILPHLMRAIKIADVLDDARATVRLFSEALDRSGLCVMLLDRHCRIVEMNGRAEEVLSRSTAISLSGQQIAPTSAGDRRRFDAAFRQATAEDGPGCAMITLTGATGAPESIMIRRASAAVAPASFAAVMYLRDPDAPYVANADTIAHLYGLKPNEARVAIAIAGGASIRETAAKLDLSEASVRTYLQRVFEKTGVHRQAALVKLIGAGLAALDDSVERDWPV